jgi:Fur family ferric uptake transcriptional regulator
MTALDAIIPNVSGHGHEHDLPPASVLRERGKRVTVQRAAIWEVLAAERDVHLSAEEVAEHVKLRLPQVNASTVYRTLDVLVDEGLVRRSDLGTGRTLFEPAHEHLHHHLVCEGCGAVAHVHDEALVDVARQLDEQHGFRLGDREIALFGLCSSCQSARSQSKGAA